MASQQIFLLLGGTGKAGRHTTNALKAKGFSDDQIRIASRHPNADKSNHVKFDFDDEATWAPALEGVSGVMIIGPTFSQDSIGLMKKFVDKALAAGVKRQVLITGLTLSRDVFWGKVHQHVSDTVPEYVVLRPTHFHDNFIAGGYYDEMVKTGGQFSDAYGDGKAAFVDGADVGAAAAEALTLPSDSPLLNKLDGYQLEGPEAFTFKEAGELLAKISGKNIRYNDVEVSTMKSSRPNDSLPPELVEAIDYVLEFQRSGKGAPMKDQGVKVLTGREPKSLAVWAEENKSAWENF